MNILNIIVLFKIKYMNILNNIVLLNICRINYKK